MCREIEPVPRDTIDMIIREAMVGNYFNYLPDWPAHRPSVFPRAEVIVITLKEDKLIPEVKKWGYEVGWNKDVIYNTRVDTAVNSEKMWFDSLQNRRCIVPVFGFFEPNQTMKPIHNRMPLMVLPDELMIWLDGDFISLFDRQNVPLEALKVH